MKSFVNKPRIGWVSAGICGAFCIVTYICGMRSGHVWFLCAAVGGMLAQTAYKDVLLSWNPIRLNTNTKGNWMCIESVVYFLCIFVWRWESVDYYMTYVAYCFNDNGFCVMMAQRSFYGLVDTYDPAGNRLTKTTYTYTTGTLGTPTNTQTYTYKTTGWGDQLADVTYNADGIRTSKTVNGTKISACHGF